MESKDPDPRPRPNRSDVPIKGNENIFRGGNAVEIFAPFWKGVFSQAAQRVDTISEDDWIVGNLTGIPNSRLPYTNGGDSNECN